jgi:hypothetical protein
MVMAWWEEVKSDMQEGCLQGNQNVASSSIHGSRTVDHKDPKHREIGLQ